METKKLVKFIIFVWALVGLGTPGVFTLQAALPVNDSVSQFLVVFPKGRFPRDAEAIIWAAGGTLQRAIPEISVAIAHSQNPDFATHLLKRPEVLGVAEDPSISWIPDDLPVEVYDQPLSYMPGPQGHDPTAARFFPLQWNMRVIQADRAWGAGFQGDPVVTVAVLDTGVDYRHIDLDGQVDLNLSKSFVPEDDTVVHTLFPGAHPVADLHFHGTHVAGIVAARGIGTAGVAPHVRIIGVKVLNQFGRGRFGAVISGIVYAASVGADVINMSLGAAFPRSCVLPDDGERFPSACATLMAALNRATNFAHSRGTLVIAAAGNSAVNADRDRDLIWVPAQSSNVVGVSATGPLFQENFDQLAVYSNFGFSLVDVAAPGGNLKIEGGRRVTPPEDLVLSPCSTFSLRIPVCRTGFFYVFAAGTSMAAPHVAGVAALGDSLARGRFNAAQLRSLVQQSADDLGKVGQDDIYGHGRVNACRAVGAC